MSAAIPAIERQLPRLAARNPDLENILVARLWPGAPEGNPGGIRREDRLAVPTPVGGRLCDDAAFSCFKRVKQNRGGGWLFIQSGRLLALSRRKPLSVGRPVQAGTVVRGFLVEPDPLPGTEDWGPRSLRRDPGRRIAGTRSASRRATRRAMSSVSLPGVSRIGEVPIHTLDVNRIV